MDRFLNKIMTPSLAMVEEVPSSEPKTSLQNFLKERAKRHKENKDLHIRDIVRLLVDESFREFGVLDNEFIEAFQKAGIAKMLVEAFVEKIQEESNGKSLLGKDDKNFIAARGKFQDFIDKYSAQGIATTASYLAEIQREFSEVNLGQLFDDDVTNEFIKKVEGAAKNVAKNRFEEMYEQDPAEAIERYILPQVFSVDAIRTPAKISINGKNLEKTFQFLDDHGALKEIPFYEALYSYFQKSEIFCKVQWVRGKALKVGNDTLSITEGFDFQHFFKTQIAPKIEEFRAKKIQEKSRKPEISLGHIIEINLPGMSETIVPGAGANVIRRLLSKSEDRSSERSLVEGEKRMTMDEARKFYLEKIFTMEGTGPEEMEKLISSLRKGKDQIKWSIGEVLPKGKNRKKAKEKLEFLKEIMECEDIEKLLTWMLYPAKLLNELSEVRKQEIIKKYSTNVLAVLSDQARKIIEMTILHRKCVEKPQVKQRKADKNRLKKSIVKQMEMEESNEFHTMKFQIRQNLNPNKESNPPEPEFEVMKDEGKFTPCPKGKEITDSEGKYRYFPVEEKNFKKVTVTLPDFTGEDPRIKRKINLLVYGGEKKELIHMKDIHSIVSNFMRDGQDHPDFTDILRWTIIPEKPDDYEYLGAYFRTCMAFNTKKVRILNAPTPSNGNEPENGVVSMRANAIKEQRASVSTPSFKNHNREILSQYITPKGYHQVNFETQIVQNLDDFLIFTGSDHTDTAHRKFRVIREMPVVKGALHSPVVYGHETIEFLKSLLPKKTKPTNKIAA